MAICPVCGHQSEGAKFCPECGAALTAAAERREERKDVTVLYADLVGFTSRAQTLDPEEVRAVLAPYWERLRTELERFGGTVEKFIGDAVMALFGAPTAHEDDPERAVRAALAIRDWVREEEDLQVRVAVNTGEALVLLGARPAEGEGMAAGDVVNTAARLQIAAPVNGVLVGETTYRATRHMIEYREHEPVAAKGKTDPIPVWEAFEARSRFGSDVEQQTLLPLVGRERELETLLGALERARLQKEPQLVTLVGVPGIGKSRLVAELFTSLRGPELVFWRQGRSLPYGDGVSFWALVEMVKAQAGISENDPPAEAEAKLRASAETVAEGDELAWLVHHLRPLVGLEQEQALGDRRDESFAAWRRYFEGLAEQRPLVLVFEDLHWADDGLLDFVDHLAEWTSGVPLLLLGTARPELLDRRPGWGGGKLNVSTLALPPLADEDAAHIIGTVLEQTLLPAETQQVLLDRAGGNPLYAEQFAQLYRERGSTEDLPLPETIQGIIAARLDGLDPDEKRLLQNAAVVGKVFWAGAASALAGADDVKRALHSLERKGLVRRERRSAVGGEDQYAFRHVLVRDVAYGQIPRAERAAKHVRAAGWIEGLGRADDHAELVSHHYAAALELSPDEATAARARHAFRRAGERALKLNAFASAQRFYADALALWPEADEERPHVLLGHAQSRYYAEGDDGGLVEAARQLERAGATEAAAEANALAAHAAWRGGRQTEARERVDAARALVEGRPPSRARAAVLAEAGRLDVFAGLRADGIPMCEEALRLAEALQLDDLRANVLNTLAVATISEGDEPAARALAEEAIEIAASTAASEVARALINLAAFASRGHDRAAWDAAHARALEFATRLGDRRMLLWLEPATIGQAERDGRWDEALARCNAYLASVELLGGSYNDPSVLQTRAGIRAARDELEPARRDLDRSLELVEAGEDPQRTVPYLFFGASISLRLGDDDRARVLLDRVFARFPVVPEPIVGMRGNVAATVARVGRTAEMLAWLAPALPTPRAEAARLLLAGKTLEAVDLYATFRSPNEEAAVRLFAAQELVAAGRRAEADIQLQRALAFYRAVGATRIVREAETLLAAAG